MLKQACQHRFGGVYLRKYQQMCETKKRQEIISCTISLNPRASKRTPNMRARLVLTLILKKNLCGVSLEQKTNSSLFPLSKSYLLYIPSLEDCFKSIRVFPECLPLQPIQAYFCETMPGGFSSSNQQVLCYSTNLLLIKLHDSSS